MGSSSGDDGDELGKARHAVLLISAGITFAYVIGSFFIYGCLCTFRLRYHQMKHVVHMRERLSAMGFLFMLAITQGTSLNLSWYVSAEYVARRVGEPALLSWTMLTGLALMTLLVAAFSRTYARIHMYLGIVFTTCATLVLISDAVVSGKVAILDPLLGATCLVGLWTVFYTVPMAFHLTTLMTGPSDLSDAAYDVALGLGHASKASTTTLLQSNTATIMTTTAAENEIILSDVDSINYMMDAKGQKQEFVYASDTSATELDEVHFSSQTDIEET